MRLAREGPPEQHVTIPAHSPLKVGTLAGILGEIAMQLGITRDDLLTKLFH